MVAGATPLVAQHEGVLSTVHNLSVSGPGEIRAVSETQVCKFCHVPHNAELPAPLWGRPLSDASYEVPELTVAGPRRPAPQPDGSSRLCLSCHDGAIALGEVVGEQLPIKMAGASRLHPGSRGFLGTDLSGSHPISFVVPDGDRQTAAGDSSDLALRPLHLIRSDPDVMLDSQGKMQCTTCHDPHSDRNHVEGLVPRFWVKASVDEVCLACHTLR